ncbi:MAG: HAD-IA family hydrolase [bacterium]|nr:HAD-IA family hydrolase [bacterium]
MRQPYNVIIFDCDGVIINSSFHYFISWKRIFDEEGVPFTMVDYQMKVSGGTRRVGFRKIMGELSDKKIEALSRRKQEFFEQLIAIDPPQPFPGMTELLEFFRNKNITLALTSSSKNAYATLTRTNLLSYFDVVVTPHHAPTLDTDTELFRLTMQQLGKKPSECIVVEDSPTSIAEAKALGAFVVGLSVIVPPEALKNADAVATGHKDLLPVLSRLCGL